MRREAGRSRSQSGHAGKRREPALERKTRQSIPPIRAVPRSGNGPRGLNRSNQSAQLTLRGKNTATKIENNSKIFNVSIGTKEIDLKIDSHEIDMDERPRQRCEMHLYRRFVLRGALLTDCASVFIQA
jgi:hypothetical protein